MPVKPALGLYFTDHFVEISQVSADGKRLVRFNQMSLPEQMVVNGEIKDMSGFTKILSILMAQTKPKPVRAGEEVVIGVSDNRIFIREFTLPKLAGKRVEDAIDWQVHSLLPVLPSEIETDWQIIGHNVEDEIEVLMTAIPEKLIQAYLLAAAGVGLQVIAIEPAVFANIRAIKTDQMKNKNQLLVYIGDGFAEFTFITGGNPRFSDFLTEAEIKRKGSMIEAIKDYVFFANSKHPTRAVQEIIISGYGQQIPEVITTLQAQKVAVYSAVSRLGSIAVKDHGLLRTAHGLSLKTLESSPTLNLLPISFRLEVTRHRLTSIWKSVLSILFAITFLAGIWLLYFYQVTLNRQAEMTLLRDEYKLKLGQPTNQTLISTADKLNLITGQLVQLRDATGGEGGLLKEIAAVAPTGLALTSLAYSRGAESVKLPDPKSTWAITGTANSRELVLDFYNKLLAQPDFTNGRLYFGSLEKETGTTFRIASLEKL